MRAVVQRVSHAEVRVEGRVTGSIGQGLLALVGIELGDTREDALYILRKLWELRVFNDEEGKLNRSVQDAGGSLLLVSQFTLLGDCRRGRRPSYSDSMPPGPARDFFESFVEEARRGPVPVETGEFQAMMDVELVNDGPVTLLLDSRKRL